MSDFKATVFCPGCEVMQKAEAPQQLGDEAVMHCCPVCHEVFFVALVSGQGFVVRTRNLASEPTRVVKVRS